MRSWNIKDGPTAANLALLEDLGRPWQKVDVESFMEVIRAVIGIERMLPAAVRRHFAFPMLYFGDSASHWPQAFLEGRARELCDAINDGLDAIASDPSLGKGGDADLSDRPPTKGEEIEEAVDACRHYRGAAELGSLRTALAGTTLWRRMDRLDHWLRRKRPSPGGRPIEHEIVSLLWDIGRDAQDYHHRPASHCFQRRNS